MRQPDFCVVLATQPPISPRRLDSDLVTASIKNCQRVVLTSRSHAVFGGLQEELRERGRLFFAWKNYLSIILELRPYSIGAGGLACGVTVRDLAGESPAIGRPDGLRGDLGGP